MIGIARTLIVAGEVLLLLSSNCDRLTAEGKPPPPVSKVEATKTVSKPMKMLRDFTKRTVMTSMVSIGEYPGRPCCMNFFSCCLTK